MAQKVSYNEGTDVFRCKCQWDKEKNPQGAEYQDKAYGKGIRVHNKCDKGWRCTVCGATRD